MKKALLLSLLLCGACLVYGGEPKNDRAKKVEQINRELNQLQEERDQLEKEKAKLQTELREEEAVLEKKRKALNEHRAKARAAWELKQSDELDEKMAELANKITNEIDTLGKHPWAGFYFEGDGLGKNFGLALAPKEGFTFEWHGCMGIYDRNYGKIEEQTGKLHLSFTLSNDFRGLDDVLIPVVWGDRHYLIPENKFIDFCNEVNSGSEPRKSARGSCLLRIDDEKKKVEGLPTIPKEFAPYLLKEPIETEIVFVEKPVISPFTDDVQEIVFCVTLKHGKKSGLLPGMKLHINTPENSSDMIEIKKVEDEQAVGDISRISIKGLTGAALDLLETNPKPGWKASTRNSHHKKSDTNIREKFVSPRVFEVFPAQLSNYCPPYSWLKANR